jgi:hypothetical protein
MKVFSGALLLVNCSPFKVCGLSFFQFRDQLSFTYKLFASASLEVFFLFLFLQDNIKELEQKREMLA